MSNDNKQVNLKDAVLADLWDAATFDKYAYKLIEKITLNMDRKKISGKNNDLISPEIAFELSTIRNRDLINLKQQQVLRKTVVGFFGLSVGSHAVSTWMMESRADKVRIADPDYITPSNLNRLFTGWDAVGKDKTEIVRKQINKINPFAHVIVTKGKPYTEMRKMFTESPHINIVVDEIDDLVGKIHLRKFAQEMHIPLISVTDVGDNVIVDIERYDKKPYPKPFLGRMPNLDFNSDYSRLSLKEKVRLTMQIIGFDVCSEALLDSLLGIGKKFKTWPQLGATSVMAGGIITTVIKKIILEEEVESGRYFVSLDNLLVRDNNSQERKSLRDKKIQQFKAKYNLL